MAKIKLTKGYYALVDDGLFDELNKHSWCYSMGYAVRRCAIEKRIIRMHRVIAGAKSGEEIDHINRNKLDNRVSNLRVASRSLNSINRDTPANSTSGRKGVCWDKAKKRWKAYIKLNQVMKNLGRYKTIYQAIRARELAEKQYHG